MGRSLRKMVILFLDMGKLNFKGFLEYRTNFWLQVFGTLLNNVIYIVFWAIIFEKFKSLGQYEMNDMLLLFSIVTTGFGVSMVFFGNSFMIGENIATGKLDMYLSYPGSTMTLLLCSRSSLSAVGDMLFGLAAFIFAGYLSPEAMIIWLLCCLSTAIIITAVHTIVGSLAFWLGNSQALTELVGSSLLNFALYPNAIFKGWVKYLLLTVIPAGLIGAVPGSIVKTVSFLDISILLLIAILIGLGAVAVFKWGLRRYESTSSMNLNR